MADEPMNDILLQAIRKNNTVERGVPSVVVSDITALLAEVDRLRAVYESVDNAGQALMIAYERVRAENAAMRLIVEAVANLADNSYGACVVCGFDSDDHGPGCPAEQARAFVAAHPATATDGETESEEED